MSGTQSYPIPESDDSGEIERTLDQNEGQQARAQERSSGRAEKRLELPGYEVQRSLGRGAYGEVWLAVQENTGREVAVKVFSRHKGLDWPLLKREVSKLVQVLGERRIVHLLAVGWDADPPYYIMEFVRGGSLADRLGGKPMPADQAIPLFREVAEALVYLHGKAILHCDLKPSNVLLDERDQVRLADFGQARLSDEEGPPAGTLFYMAPELTEPNARPDVRSDIYSLGAALYTMLTGKPPYAAANSTRDLASTSTLSDRLQLYRDMVERSPLPTEHHHIAGVDKALAVIVDRCLRRNPAERFANVQQVLDALATRERRRAQFPLIAFGVLGPAALLAALFGFGYWAWSTTHTQADLALTMQVRASNLEMARIIAAAVDDRLEGITRRVSKEAENKSLVALLNEANKAAGQGVRAGGPSQNLQHYTDGLERQYSGRTFFSWFVAGRDAYMWARSPTDPIIGHFFPDREWFNGKENYARGSVSLPPREGAGLTQIFPSRAEGKFLVFTAASPIKASAKGAALGVLATSLRLDKFNKWLDVAEGDLAKDGCPDRFVVLVNGHGQLMRHPCLRSGSPEIPLQRKDFLDKIDMSNLLLPKVDRDSYKDYKDPLRPGELYVAAASQLQQNPGWYVIVQQSKPTALRPVHDLTEQFDKLGTSAVVAGLAVVAALWIVLFQVIRAAPRSGPFLKGAKPVEERS
jgi:serine/threonine protein kinase